MFKNVCFIPIQLARLRQAAAAARLQRQWYGEGGGGMGGPSFGGSLGGPSNDSRFGSIVGGPFPSVGRGPRLPPAAAAAVALEALAAEQLSMGAQGEETGRSKSSRGAPWGNKSLRRQGHRRASQANAYSPIHELHAPEGPPGIDRSHPNHQQQQQQQQHRHRLRASLDGPDSCAAAATAAAASVVAADAAAAAAVKVYERVGAWLDWWVCARQQQRRRVVSPPLGFRCEGFCSGLSTRYGSNLDAAAAAVAAAV
ncbi:hypothetical protein Emag_006959 [Eimeria magna]